MIKQLFKALHVKYIRTLNISILRYITTNVMSTLYKYMYTSTTYVAVMPYGETPVNIGSGHGMMPDSTITDIDQHWPRLWHVTWRHQATTQDQWWDIITGICQHCPRPWPVTARCQATTWANAEITCVNPLANTYGSFNTNTRGIIPWDQPEKYI